MSSGNIALLIAHQLLCARITADVRMSNTCCASVAQVLDGELRSDAYYNIFGL